MCDPSGRSDVCCFARSVLSEHRVNHSIPAENISERDPISPADEENLLSEENESANSSHQGTDKMLADILSAMTQMSSTMLSMEKGMKRLAGAPEDTLLNEIAQDFESDEQNDLKVAQKLADGE